MNFPQYHNEAPIERAYGLSVERVRQLNSMLVEIQIRRGGASADDAAKWRQAANNENESEAREYLLAHDIAQARQPEAGASMTENAWARWYAMRAEVNVIWDGDRVRRVDAQQIRDAAAAAGIPGIPDSLSAIRRLRRDRDAASLVAARFIADTETQAILSGPAADLVWSMSSAVDPEVQVAFLLGSGNRARVMHHLRRFGLAEYAALLGRRSDAHLSGAEIHELRQRAVGWSDRDYDIIDEYDLSD